jgi:hypothetical protein
MLRPVISTRGARGSMQSSYFADWSPVEMIVPPTTAGVGTEVTAPCVWPEIRFRWPGVVGPNTVEYELSLMAKRCA